LAVPEGSVEAEEITSAEGETRSERAADVVCAGLAESVTEAVKAAVPVEIGVPEINPVDEARLSPAGRLPEVMDHV
jgi:hypothetical protein